MHSNLVNRVQEFDAMDPIHAVMCRWFGDCGFFRQCPYPLPKTSTPNPISNKTRGTSSRVL